nr:hypothetical protein BaRGS_034615 [Batillaria attramentaria]
MVFKANSRFTDEEYNAYVELKKLLGNDMASHTIAVFTGGDVLKTENIDVRSEIENASPNFKTMMAEISNRYVIINNRETDEGEKKKQLSALVEKIQDLARDHAKSGMQENVSKLVKEAVDKKSAAKKIPKEQAREEYNREVMQYGTDEAGTRPMPVPYNFPKVVETVKNETHKKSVKINLCTLL